MIFTIKNEDREFEDTSDFIRYFKNPLLKTMTTESQDNIRYGSMFFRNKDKLFKVKNYNPSLYNDFRKVIRERKFEYVEFSICTYNIFFGLKKDRVTYTNFFKSNREYCFDSKIDRVLTERVFDNKNKALPNRLNWLLSDVDSVQNIDDIEDEMKTIIEDILMDEVFTEDTFMAFSFQDEEGIYHIQALEEC